MQKRVLDFSYVINMVGDDAEGLIEVFETFLKQMPIYFEELDQALNQQDWDKVARYAHKIKPIFGYVGCNDVRDLMRSIEEKAQNRIELASISADIETLKAQSAEINKLIEAEKDRLKAKRSEAD